MTDVTDAIQSPRLHVATRVADMDIATLHNELRRAIQVTAETIAYLGEIWRELDRRGEDLTGYRVGMGRFLPLVAAGQLAPEAVVRFSGRIQLLRAVQLLPLPEQQRLATGSGVTVAVVNPDGSIGERSIPVDSLTGDQLRLAFDGGRIRSVAEQVNMLESARTAAKRRSNTPSGRRYRPTLDDTKTLLRVGRMQVPVVEVLAVLRAAGVIDPAE